MISRGDASWSHMRRLSFGRNEPGDQLHPDKFWRALTKSGLD